MASPPIFVLCCSRSGSTLLRYILDTHPRIFCPPELHLCDLAVNLKWVFEHIATGKPDKSEAEITRSIEQKIQRCINQIMSTHAKAENKQIWCEKSVFTIKHIPLIHSVFPSARYLCLYRNCIDQVSSAMETLVSDPTGKAYGYTHFLQNANFDQVNGLVDYWLWMTNANLQYEKINPKQTYRVTYESLVTDSENSLKNLFAFLDLKWNGNLLEKVFTKDRPKSPGDHKINDTNRIESTSVGKKSALEVQQITLDRIKKINALHEILGYTPVDGTTVYNLSNPGDSL